MVKNPPANAAGARDLSSTPGSGRSPEEEMATHPSVPAGITLWTEEPRNPETLHSFTPKSETERQG